MLIKPDVPVFVIDVGHPRAESSVRFDVFEMIREFEAAFFEFVL